MTRRRNQEKTQVPATDVKRPYRPSASPVTTEGEKEFLMHLNAIGKRGLIRKYLDSMHKRTRWEGIDPAKVRTFGETLLANTA